MCKAARKIRLGPPIPEGYSKLEDAIARSKAKREEKNK